jgi:hypothetical protein
MKNYLLFLSIFISYISNAQILNREKPKVIECLTKAELKAFNKDGFAKRDVLLNSRNISKAQLRAAAPQQILFGWPLQANADYDFTYNNTTISNFVDQNRTADPAGDDDVREPEWMDDWNCGKRTYDNHDAEDISNWPFSWHMYDVNATIAIAAADGEILDKQDGNYSKNCAWTSGVSPNFVKILHADGTISSYLHLKSGTVTSLPASTPGNPTRVKQGDYLGIVGSSGRSTGPHLHFSIYDLNDNLIDPFTGNCNALNNSTWWQNQRNYWEPQINKVMTHSEIPSYGCWDEEVFNGKNNFVVGETCIIGTYLQDAQNNDEIVGDLFSPNGDLVSSWTHTITSTDNSHSYYKAQLLLLPSGNSGTWIVRMTYRNKNYYHFFTVGCNSTESVFGPRNGSEGFIASSSIVSIVEHTTNSMSKVLYQAGTEITFLPGFEIKAGAHLKARIKGCNFVE